MKCQICSNEKSLEVYSCREFMFEMLDRFNYFRCPKCGCLQIEQIPTDLERFYRFDYYSYENLKKFQDRSFFYRLKKKFRYSHLFFPKAFGGRLAGFFRKKNWISCLDWRRDWRILDVGCGNGFLLHLMGQCGFESLTGIDPFISEEIQTPQYHIFKQDVTRCEGSFDCILLSHSLEHMPNQLEALRNVERLLAPDGRILIRIPVFSEFFFERYGEFWYSWDAPRHFFLHTTESFQKAAEAAGLRVELIFPEPKKLNVRMSENRLRRYGKASGPASKAEVHRIFRELLQSGQPDNCTFVLRRRS